MKSLIISLLLLITNTAFAGYITEKIPALDSNPEAIGITEEGKDCVLHIERSSNDMGYSYNFNLTTTDTAFNFNFFGYGAVITLSSDLIELKDILTTQRPKKILIFTFEDNIISSATIDTYSLWGFRTSSTRCIF